MWHLSFSLRATSVPFLASAQPLEPFFLITMFTCTFWRLLKCPDKPLQSKAWSCSRGRDQRETITWAPAGITRAGLPEHAWRGRVGSRPCARGHRPPSHPATHRGAGPGTSLPPQQPQPADAIGDHRRVSTLGQKGIHKVSEHLKNKASNEPRSEAKFGAGSVPCPSHNGRQLH